MKILLLGKNGQVGWELQRSLKPLGDVIALGSEPEGGLSGDLSDVDALRATIRALKPDAIVNAGAYTAVDKAESEPDLAMAINGVAPGVLAEEAKRLGAWLVHYSTDYVFDGSGDKPWKETDPTGPLNVYGKTKLVGEQAIQAEWEKHLIFRTSWVYGVHGNNFIKTILRLAQERESLSIINDQFGAPTGADLIADITAVALNLAAESRALAGLYHLAAAGETNWYEYACFILSVAQAAGLTLKLDVRDIQAVPSSAYSTAAQRPRNSRLSCDKTKQHLQSLPQWDAGVLQVLKGIFAGSVNQASQS